MKRVCCLLMLLMMLFPAGGLASGGIQNLWGTPLPSATPSPTPAAGETAAASAGGFTFRSGIRWDMSLDLVRALETVPMTERSNGGWSILYPLSPVEVSRYTADLVYMFFNDRLKMIAYSFSQGSESDFQYLAGALDSLYGTRSEPAAEEIILFNDQIYPGHYKAEQLKKRYGWSAGEDTLIFLYYFSDSAYEILYVNAGEYKGGYNTTGL